ncbi:MAG: hypothetical protein LBC76_00240 [Treponema sp.]|jgi:hypothetical protein|nr:hypothetical protein [Treponema sp.]
MVCKNSKSIKIIPAVIIFFLFLSCQTAPKVQDMPEGTLPLAKGASVYIIANARQAHPIIELLPIVELNNKQTRQMLEKTDSFAAAVFPQTSVQKIQIAANGNYPGLSGLAFTFNKNWKKQRVKSGGSYWYSAANGLSIAMNTNQAFVVSSVDKTPVDPVTSESGVTMPEGFYEFSRGYPVSCWLEDTAPLLSRIFSEKEIPIQLNVQYVFINLYPADSFDLQNQYEALIRLRFENALQSRGMAAIFNLAAGLMPNDNSTLASIFFANPAVQNGRSLDIKTKRLTEKDITLLLETFLL